MNKMDEIMELLTDEIDGFNKSIVKLEALSKNFEDIQVTVDNTKIEELIRKHLEQERLKTTEIQKKVKSATLIPKWLLALFSVALILITLIIGYLTFQIIKTENKIDEAYGQGEQEMTLKLTSFFDAYPDAYTDFQKWSKEKDSLTNHK